MKTTITLSLLISALCLMPTLAGAQQNVTYGMEEVRHNLSPQRAETICVQKSPENHCNRWETEYYQIILSKSYCQQRNAEGTCLDWITFPATEVQRVTQQDPKLRIYGKEKIMYVMSPFEKKTVCTSPNADGTCSSWVSTTSRSVVNKAYCGNWGDGRGDCISWIPFPLPQEDL